VRGKIDFALFVVAVFFLAFFLAGALPGATRYTPCQSQCNTSYRAAYRECRASPNVTACRASAWTAWQACFYSCPQ